MEENLLTKQDFLSKMLNGVCTHSVLLLLTRENGELKNGNESRSYSGKQKQKT